MRIAIVINSLFILIGWAGSYLGDVNGSRLYLFVILINKRIHKKITLGTCFFDMLILDIVRESNYETEGCKFLQVNFCFVGRGGGRQ